MNRKRKITAVVALALIFTFAIGGAMAWLKDETSPVTNTFKFDADIDITLSEDAKNVSGEDITGTDNKYEYGDFLPGDVMTKDPIVTVAKGSEACWVFVIVKEENNTVGDGDNSKQIVQYAVNTGDSLWQALTDGGTQVTHDGGNVYYIDQNEIEDTASDAVYHVLKGPGDEGEVGKVKVNSDLTETDWDSIQARNDQATNIIISAGAIQKTAAATAKAAFDLLYPTTPATP